MPIDDPAVATPATIRSTPNELVGEMERDMDLGDITDKAKGLLEEHADKVDEGIDKAAELADDKTGGKYSDQIDTAADKLKDVLPEGS